MKRERENKNTKNIEKREMGTKEKDVKEESSIKEYKDEPLIENPVKKSDSQNFSRPAAFF